MTQGEITLLEEFGDELVALVDRYGKIALATNVPAHSFVLAVCAQFGVTARGIGDVLKVPREATFHSLIGPFVKR